jgi:hypothetical protein
MPIRYSMTERNEEKERSSPTMMGYESTQSGIVMERRGPCWSACETICGCFEFKLIKNKQIFDHVSRRDLLVSSSLACPPNYRLLGYRTFNKIFCNYLFWILFRKGLLVSFMQLKVKDSSIPPPSWSASFLSIHIHPSIHPSQQDPEAEYRK